MEVCESELWKQKRESKWRVRKRERRNKKGEDEKGGKNGAPYITAREMGSEYHAKFHIQTNTYIYILPSPIMHCTLAFGQQLLFTIALHCPQRCIFPVGTGPFHNRKPISLQPNLHRPKLPKRTKQRNRKFYPLENDLVKWNYTVFNQ